MGRQKRQRTGTSGELMIGLLEGFMWLDRGLQENLKARGLPHVRRLESMVMVYAAAGVQRPSELARQLGVTRQSINSAIRDLEGKDLIALAPDPQDRRCKIVELSNTGMPVHREAESILAALARTLEERIGAEAVAMLSQITGTDWGTPPLVVTANKKRRAHA
ncbi:MAG: MarR family transcriptional regulator [Parvibaculaceae bacterium]